MPNWCDTTYRCVGDKENVKKLYDAAMKSFNPPANWKSLSNEGWLGYIVMELGGDYKNVYCRGWLYQEPQLSEDGETVTICANTAWTETNEFREFICNTLKLDVYYVAMEPGCDYYMTNDPEYDGKYFVDSSPDQPDDPFMTEDEVCSYICNQFSKNVINIDECIAFSEEYNEDNDDDFIYIHEMEYNN